MSRCDSNDIIDDVALVGARGLEEDSPSKNRLILALHMPSGNDAQATPWGHLKEYVFRVGALRSHSDLAISISYLMLSHCTFKK